MKLEVREGVIGVRFEFAKLNGLTSSYDDETGVISFDRDEVEKEAVRFNQSFDERLGNIVSGLVAFPYEVKLHDQLTQGS